MEIGKQIKKYRTLQNLSQEQLAFKIFVTRQTISNWENDKNYPDIKSLVLLSYLFDISLDTLIKGDVEKMEEKIKNNDVKKFSKIYFIRTALAIFYFTVSPFIWKGYLGEIAIYVNYVLAIVMLYYVSKLAKLKKINDISTYKEILAFTNNTILSEEQKNCELKKRKYQGILLALLMVSLIIVYSKVLNYFIFN